MSKQPKALRLAKRVIQATHEWWGPYAQVAKPVLSEAAAELRRLHSVNADLLEALKNMIELSEFWINREDRQDMSDAEHSRWLSLGFRSSAMLKARAAIAKAEEA